MTMREWWANVYRDGDEAVVGLKWDYRALCAEEAASDAQFRIHVRLKPEGAPKRYADRWDRWNWENDTEWMQQRAAGLVP